MRVLVTGGYGFIGSHVLGQLVDRGDDVACLDVADPSPVAQPVAAGVTDVRGDVTDAAEVYDAIATFEPERIVHLAALLGRKSQRRPRRAVTVNLLGTTNVLEAAESPASTASSPPPARPPTGASPRIGPPSTRRPARRPRASTA